MQVKLIDGVEDGEQVVGKTEEEDGVYVVGTHEGLADGSAVGSEDLV